MEDDKKQYGSELENKIKENERLVDKSTRLEANIKKLLSRQSRLCSMLTKEREKISGLQNQLDMEQKGKKRQ